MVYSPYPRRLESLTICLKSEAVSSAGKRTFSMRVYFKFKKKADFSNEYCNRKLKLKLLSVQFFLID